MREFNQLFYEGKDSFLSKLEPTNEDKEIIRNAIGEIKKILQAGISKEYYISPRFMTQGSARYKTLNCPSKIPPQQMDHDVGCYLPLSYHMDGKMPKQAANSFFRTVDSILSGLVEDMEWKAYSSDKDTCCRVIVNERIHIDIPLYSVPDSEFTHICEAKDSIGLEKSLMFSDSRSSYQEETWENFKFNNVMLAHRSVGWKVSDPRKLNDYFEKIVNLKGEQIRRLFRYLKAFRDQQWLTKGPSSIYLMCVVNELISNEVMEGDDYALLLILKDMAKLKSRSVTNPIDKDELISISANDFELLTNKCDEFYKDLEKAIYDEKLTGYESCELIKRHLGERFPLKNISFDPDRLKTIVHNIMPETPSSRDIPLRTRAG